MSTLPSQASLGLYPLTCPHETADQLGSARLASSPRGQQRLLGWQGDFSCIYGAPWVQLSEHLEGAYISRPPCPGCCYPAFLSVNNHHGQEWSPRGRQPHKHRDLCGMAPRASRPMICASPQGRGRLHCPSIRRHSHTMPACVGVPISLALIAL